MPLWQLFSTYGSYRVVSASAEELRLMGHPNLPHPVRGRLGPRGEERLASVDVDELPVDQHGALPEVQPISGQPEELPRTAEGDRQNYTF